MRIRPPRFSRSLRAIGGLCLLVGAPACGGAPGAAVVRGGGGASTLAERTWPVRVPAPQATSLVDWATYANDAARDGFAQQGAAFTPASLATLHVAWYASLQSGSGTQPIVVTGIPGHAALLIVGGGNGYERAYDGITGNPVWTTYLGIENEGPCGHGGVGGTAQYDPARGAVYVTGGDSGTVNHDVLYRLDPSNGAITARTDLTPDLLPGESTSTHTAVTESNGTLYAGTGSNCEDASWRGRVVAVDASTMAVAGRFFTTYAPNRHVGGGGVWGWGGVSADGAGNVYFGAGNAETTATTNGGTIAPPFVAASGEDAGYAEHFTETTGSLAAVVSSDDPGFDFATGGDDLDFPGTPVLFRPPGCDPLAAIQGKGGILAVYDTAQPGPPVARFAFATPSGLADYVGNPAYSPLTGVLYAAISSSTDSLAPPGLAAIAACGTALAWHAPFGPDSFAYRSFGATPRSAPTVTSGGVVFLGTPCTATAGGGCGTPGALGGAVWAVDASSGAVLGGGNPILQTGDDVRTAPTVDGAWMWVLDDSGNFYGLTVDPAVPALAHLPLPAHGLRALRWRR